MAATTRRICDISALLVTGVLAVGCAGATNTVPFTAAPETASMVWYGQTCFEDESGAPVVNRVATFRRAGATWGPREVTDARGCVAAAGFGEGLYSASVEGVQGDHDLYIAEGDAVRVRFGGPDDGVEYEGGASLSATILELVEAEGASDEVRQRVVQRALAFPEGTQPHKVGVLASFALRGDWANGDAPRWQNHSVREAQQLLYTLPPDSPWLSAWPTAPIGAALTLGYTPSEHPALRELALRSESPAVVRSLMLFDLHAARANGDEARAEALTRTLDRMPGAGSTCCDARG